MQRTGITDNLDAFIDVFPTHIADALQKVGDLDALLEVIMDFGRLAEARYGDRNVRLSEKEVSLEDIHYVTSKLSAFGDDNRAGIERTLHRISAIRNRKGDIIGLSCRVGRAVFGTIKIIEDIVQSNKSILLSGRPGVGKTTMLREIARVLSDEMGKRVVIVDTSNEIAGDGDIPHPAIGLARRMQVAKTAAQHAVMIEAVENHMPEVIIIDEIGNELEAVAARTIAERGVQLIGTAHGNTLENLLINPTLSDLIGGVQAVTLGDEEAKRRGTQKTILERKSPPTFNVVVDIVDRYAVAIHHDTAAAVDSQLRNGLCNTEMRHINNDGKIEVSKSCPAKSLPKTTAAITVATPTMGQTPRIYLYGLSKSRFEQVAGELNIKINWAEYMTEADIFVTSKNFFRNKSQKIHDAEASNLPIYVLKNHTPVQFKQFLSSTQPVKGKPFLSNSQSRTTDTVKRAAKETETAISLVLSGQEEVELSPQSAYIRRLQHLLAEQSHVQSQSRGREPHRRVFISNEPLENENADKIDYSKLEEEAIMAEQARELSDTYTITEQKLSEQYEKLRNFNFSEEERD